MSVDIVINPAKHYQMLSESESQQFRKHGFKAVKETAKEIQKSHAWTRLNELWASDEHYDERMRECCMQCGYPLIQALQGQKLTEGTCSLISHAMHTADGGEIIRLTNILAKKGRM